VTVSARQARFAILAVLAASSISTACSSSSDAPLPPSGLHYLLNPATYAANVAIAANPPSVSGGAATSFAVSPALPAGLNLDTSTGVVTGTPTAVTPAATYVVTATNASGSATTGLVVAVGPSVRPPYGLSYSANPVIYAVGKAAPPNVPTSSGGAVTS